jgi:2-haloacid dehalogenase
LWFARLLRDGFGVQPHGLMLVATHPWDCAGAHAAGLAAAWSSAPTGTGRPSSRPRLAAADLVSLAGTILADQ